MGRTLAMLGSILFKILLIGFGEYHDDVLSGERDLILSFPVEITSINQKPVFKLFKDRSIRDSVDEFCKKYSLDEKSAICLDLFDNASLHASSLNDKSRMRTAVIIIGTRPEAIKLALLIPALERWNELLNITIISTGQHNEMLKPVLKRFNITTHYDLDLINSNSNSVYSRESESKDSNNMVHFLSSCLLGINKIFQTIGPSIIDLVVVQGDTNSALAGSLAEAGLRTWTNEAPYPEEFNRRTIDTIARLCFAPTPSAKDALLRDGIEERKIHTVGNTIIDVVHHILNIANLTSSELEFLESLPVAQNNKDSRKSIQKHIIISTHRRENFGDGIQAITSAVVELAVMFPQHPFLFLVHLNPSVDGPVRKALRGVKNVHLLGPVEYAPFLRILATAALVVSDSGGIQEEASFLGVPCIVLREVTEREEGVRVGVASLVPLTKESIVQAVARAMNPKNEQDVAVVLSKSSMYKKIYGDGHAIDRIACRIADFLKLDTTSCHGERLDGNEDNNMMKDCRFPDQAPLIPRTIPASPVKSSQMITALKEHKLGTHSYHYLHPYRKPGSITVILTQYKRNTTEAQIRAIYSQKPSHILSSIESIIIYQNEFHVDLSFLDRIDFEKEFAGVSSKSKTKSKPSIPPIQVVNSKHRNFKFHGRFTIPLLVDSEYVVIFDDDTVPRDGWIEHAIVHSRKFNAIVGAVGMIVAPDSQGFVVAPLEFPLEVDYVGHSWVMKSEWVSYLWREWVPSWECCEDLGMSASAWLHAGIRTIVPPLPYNNYSVWGDSLRHHHKDGKESFTKTVPASMRWPVTRYWVDRGWVPVALRNAMLGPGSACGEPFPKLCQATFDHLYRGKIRETPGLKQESGLVTERADKFVSKTILSNYIKVQFDPLTYIFEDKWPPEAEQEAAAAAAKQGEQIGASPLASATQDDRQSLESEDTGKSFHSESSKKKDKKRNRRKKKNESVTESHSDL